MPMPPLNAVRAFEAAARHSGLKSAAEELGVSPAAVSQQVRKLEGWFGRQLFRRLNNRVVLTDAGEALYPEIAEAMGRLDALAARLVEGRAPRRIVLSLPASLAAGWLRPHWAALADALPDARLDLRVEDDPVAFARADIDLRISYGTGGYPDLATEVLVQDSAVPVCAPGFLAARPGLAPETLAEEDLIHTSWGPSWVNHPTWAEWFGLLGLEPPSGRRPGHRAMMSSVATDMAAAGMGLALGHRMLVSADIAAGRLVVPFGPDLQLGHPYVAVMPHRKMGREDIRRLVDFLRARVR